MHGDAPTQPSDPERVAQGVLVNAGLVSFGASSTSTCESPMVPSDDVRTR